jgi:hypothetical protein
VVKRRRASEVLKSLLAGAAHMQRLAKLCVEVLQGYTARLLTNCFGRFRGLQEDCSLHNRRTHVAEMYAC